MGRYSITKSSYHYYFLFHVSLSTCKSTDITLLQSKHSKNDNTMTFISAKPTIESAKTVLAKFQVMKKLEGIQNTVDFSYVLKKQEMTEAFIS